MSDEDLVDPVEANAEDLLEAVNSALNSAVVGIKSGNFKDVKIPDLLKLIALKKELLEARPRDINVRWIESWELKPSNEE